MSRGLLIATSQEVELLRRRVDATDEYLLSVDDEVVSFTMGPEGVGLLVGLIGAGLGLGHELPGEGLAPQHRDQKAPLLLLSGAGNDARRRQCRPVRDNRQSHVSPGQLVPDDGVLV